MRAVSLLKFIPLLFVFALTACGTDASRIQAPQVGDVYQIEWKNMRGHELAYQLVKIQDIKGDSLILSPNKLYYEEKVYCLIDGDYFSLKDSYKSSKQEIKAIFDKGGIVDVFRTYEESCLGIDK